MVYVILNKKVIMEDGTIADVKGIAKEIAKNKDLIDVRVITEDMDEFNGTISQKDCQKANIFDIVNVMLDETCDSDTDAILKLSEKFEELYDKMGDGQEAFDFLMEEDMCGMLDDFDFVYSVTGENWSITVGESNSCEEYETVIQEINEIYDSNAKTIEEACSVVERRIEKTMSNVGCDPYTALKLEKEDELPDCFKVKAESDGVYVELLDI